MNTQTRTMTAFSSWALTLARGATSPAPLIAAPADSLLLMGMLKFINGRAQPQYTRSGTFLAPWGSTRSAARIISGIRTAPATLSFVRLDRSLQGRVLGWSANRMVLIHSGLPQING